MILTWIITVSWHPNAPFCLSPWLAKLGRNIGSHESKLDVAVEGFSLSSLRFSLFWELFTVPYWRMVYFTFPSTCVQQMPIFLLSFSFVAKKHRVEDKFPQGNLVTLPFYEKLFACTCLSLSGTTQLRRNLLYTFQSTITMHTQAHITGDTANQFSSTEIKWANKCWRCVASAKNLS